MVTEKGSFRQTLLLCFIAASPLFEIEAVAGASPEIKLTIEIFDKTRTDRLGRVRAGDSVVVRVLAQKIDGAAFIGSIDSMRVTLQSGFRLLGNEDPFFDLAFPGAITGPVDRYAIFTAIPEDHREIVRAWGSWTDPHNGHVYAVSGMTALRMSPADPQRVVFQNPGSTATGDKPAVIIPGVTYACTLLVYDKYGNRANKSVNVLVKSLKPDVAAVVGGAPDLVIRTDEAGVGTFMVKLTEKAQERDIVRLYAEIVGEEEGGAVEKHTVLASLKCMRPKEEEVYSRAKATETTIEYFDSQGRKIIRPVFSNQHYDAGCKRNAVLGKNGCASKVYFMRKSGR